MAIQLEIIPVVLGFANYLLYRILGFRRALVPAQGDKQRKDFDPELTDFVLTHRVGAYAAEPFAEPSPSNEPSPCDETAKSWIQVVHTWTTSVSTAVVTGSVCVFLICAVCSCTDVPLVSNCGLYHPLSNESSMNDIIHSAQIGVEPSALFDTSLALHESTAIHNGETLTENELSETPKPAFTMPLTRHETRTTLPSGAVQQKSAYWGTLHVGMPANSYRVVFDTGSGLLILPSAYCQSETCRNHKRYRRSASSSGKDINLDGSALLEDKPRDQMTVSYGTGKVEGVLVDERVCIGPQDDDAAEDVATEGVTRNDCMHMGMVAATYMSPEQFMNFEFDGILGLALPALSQGVGFNFLNAMGRTVAASAARPNTFAVFLATQEEASGEIAFGGWDQSRYRGQLGWSKVLNPEFGHWLVGIQAVRVDDTVISFCEDGACKAVVDTGTSLMSVPPKAFQSLYLNLRHVDVDESKCAGAGPRLHFDMVGISGESFTMTLTPEDYATVDMKSSQGTSPLYVNFGERPNAEPQTHCRARLMAMDLPAPIGPKVFLFGEPMLRRYYTIYDSDLPPKVGFGHVPSLHRTASVAELSDEDDSWFWGE